MNMFPQRCLTSHQGGLTYPGIALQAFLQFCIDFQLFPQIIDFNSLFLGAYLNLGKLWNMRAQNPTVLNGWWNPIQLVDSNFVRLLYVGVKDSWPNVMISFQKSGYIIYVCLSWNPFSQRNFGFIIAVFFNFPLVGFVLLNPEFSWKGVSDDFATCLWTLLLFPSQEKSSSRILSHEKFCAKELLLPVGWKHYWNHQGWDQEMPLGSVGVIDPWCIKRKWYMLGKVAVCS